MALIERLTEDELTMMEAWIDNYAFQNTSREVSVPYLLREWDSAKSKYLNRIFKDGFTLSKPIEFAKDTDELRNELETAILYSPHDDINVKAYEFYNAFYRDVISYYDDREHRDLFWSLDLLYNFHNLIENVYHGVSFEIPNPKAKHPIKVQNGSKITRVLGKIAQAYDLPNFEEFRIVHSQVLNQKKLKGTLNISIHPFDYMTMSDNDSGWSSCMSWVEDGCYREGTVEMMNSPMVVVAYLRGSEDMYVPGFNLKTGRRDYTWNNKKWRQLFIINPDMIGNIKAYPYRNDFLTAETLKWLKELAERANIGKYTSNIIKYNTFEDTCIEEIDKCVNVNPKTYNMYNDFTDNQFAYFSTDFRKSYQVLSFYYSGKPECMACGQLDTYFDGEGNLGCEDCEYTCRCEYCGDNVYDEDSLTEIDGMYLCPYCLDYECNYDAFGELHLRENLTPIVLGHENNNIKTSMDILVYNDNFSTAQLKEYFKEIHAIYNNYEKIYYVNIEDCTLKGLGLFDFISYEEALKEYNESNYRETNISNLEMEKITTEYDLKYLSGGWGCEKNFVYSFVA